MKTGFFIVEGPKAFYQIYNSFPHSVDEILMNGEYKPVKPISGDRRILTKSQFSSISRTQHSQGLIGVIALPEHCYTANLPEKVGKKILILEGIQDPGNIGTLIRTAVAFNFSGVLLTQECADPFSSKAVTASAGSVLSLWIKRVADFYPLLVELQQHGYSIIAADVKGEFDQQCLHRDKIALVLGNEGNGISFRMRQFAESLFLIPHVKKGVESLNVATAGAICMYLATHKQINQ